jgi:hypothetical protein
LIASSVYRRDHFDMTPVAEIDQSWYHDKDLSKFDRQKKALTLLVGQHDDEYARDLFARVEPRTCSQGTAEWFVDRQFSGTSSTMCSIILSVAPLIDETKEPELYEAFRTVLEYAGVQDMLLGSFAREEEQQAAAARLARDTASSDSDVDEEATDPKSIAIKWIARLTDPLVHYDEDFKEQALKDLNTVRENLDMLQWMQSILKQTGDDKRSSTVNATQKFFKDWLLKEKSRRPFEPLTIAALKKMALAAGIAVKGKKPEIIDELVKPRSQQTQAEAPSSPLLQPYITMFKQSFLRAQKSGEDRSAAAIGHRNVEPFLKRCVHFRGQQRALFLLQA